VTEKSVHDRGRPQTDLFSTQVISQSLVMFFLGALTGPYPTLQFGGACGLGNKNRLPGDGDSFTALLAILIARARSVGNVAYLFV
jgi:hypothetical protein